MYENLVVIRLTKKVQKLNVPHGYNTRQHDLLHPTQRLTLFESGFYYSASNLYNK